MIKTFIHNGHLITASSKQEAIYKIVASSKYTNILVYVDLGWSDVFPDRAQDIVDKMDKKVAYYDPSSESIACKDEKTANLIKQKVFKALDGDDDAQRHLKIGKGHTSLLLKSKELEKWVNKTYKGLLSYKESDDGICIIPRFPSDALKKDKEEDDCDVLISVYIDDELGQSHVYGLKGYLKGSLHNFTYDPIHEDFSFDEIKKLIDANLIKMKELINNYKNKQLNIVEKECNPILAKLNSIVK